MTRLHEVQAVTPSGYFYFRTEPGSLFPRVSSVYAKLSELPAGSYLAYRHKRGINLLICVN